MLLKKKESRRVSALSLCVALTFAPLFNAMADEPEVIPTDSSASMGVQPTALAEPLVQSHATAVLA
ncbi:L,D-transpeptidase, partial [Escherichia coli O8:H10]